MQLNVHADELVKGGVYMKHKIYALILAAAVSAGMCGCSGNKKADSSASENRFDAYNFSSVSDNEYNTSPDIEAKPVAEICSSIDAPVYSTLKELVDASDYIVIGHAADRGEVKEISLTGEDSLPDKTMQETTVPLTCRTLRVEKVIKGSGISENADVSFMQLGEPEDSMEVKLETGEDYVIFMNIYDDIDGKPVYQVSSFTDSTFRIKEDYSLLAGSKNEYCARYDGLQLSALVSDIEKEI